MKLIKFKSTKFYTTSLVEIKDRPQVITDKETYDSIVSGANKKIIKHNYTYWLPINEIKKLSHEGEKYFVNEIEVPQKEFYAVWGMLEYLEQPSYYKHFEERDFTVVEDEPKIEEK